MRRILIALTFVFLWHASAEASVIAVPENVPPWGMSAEAPKGGRGIYADLAYAVAHRSSTPIEVKFVPYGRMLEGVRSGEFAYAFGVVSPATAAAAPFTSTIAKVPMIAVARKGLALKSVADLHAFRDVGYLRGGSCGGLIDNDPAIHRLSQDSYVVAIRKLAAGRLDGWCSIKAGFVFNLSKLGMASEIGEELDYGDVKIGLQVTRSKIGSPEAQGVIDAVEALARDGTVAHVFQDYVGASYAP